MLPILSTLVLVRSGFRLSEEIHDRNPVHTSSTSPLHICLLTYLLTYIPPTDLLICLSIYLSIYVSMYVKRLLKTVETGTMTHGISSQTMLCRSFTVIKIKSREPRLVTKNLISLVSLCRNT